MSASLRVLMYHRIAEDDRQAAILPALVSATADTFERQMRHLAEHYAVIEPHDILAALDGSRLPERAVLITFDDAYRDFRTVAWPILRRHGLPATLFVPTGFPGAPERRVWWDRLGLAVAAYPSSVLPNTPIGPLSVGEPAQRRRSLRRLKDALLLIPHDEAVEWVERICRCTDEVNTPDTAVLSWDDIRALAKQGVTLGAHTRNHPVLTRVSSEVAGSEIRGSCDDIYRETGITPFALAYPAGFHDDFVVRLAHDAGVRLGFTCVRGINRVPLRDPLRLRRIDVTARTSPLLFRARLIGGLSHLDQLQHRIRKAVRRVALARVNRTARID
jgi:peptidoglycan/xylan/chitin deacetylase (PgdA/CDA1 family)